MDPIDDGITEWPNFSTTPLMNVCAMLSSDVQYLLDPQISSKDLFTCSMVLHLNMFGGGMNTMTVIDGEATRITFQSQDGAASQ